MRKQKGITLIALVITIIVLIILAGVSITALTDEDKGVVTKAKDAAAVTDEGAQQEDDDIKEIMDYANDSLSFPKYTVTKSTGTDLFESTVKFDFEFSPKTYSLKEKKAIAAYLTDCDSAADFEELILSFFPSSSTTYEDFLTLVSTNLGITEEEFLDGTITIMTNYLSYENVSRLSNLGVDVITIKTPYGTERQTNSLCGLPIECGFVKNGTYEFDIICNGTKKTEKVKIDNIRTYDSTAPHKVKLDFIDIDGSTGTYDVDDSGTFTTVTGGELLDVQSKITIKHDPSASIVNLVNKNEEFFKYYGNVEEWKVWSANSKQFIQLFTIVYLLMNNAPEMFEEYTMRQLIFFMCIEEMNTIIEDYESLATEASANIMGYMVDYFDEIILKYLAGETIDNDAMGQKYPQMNSSNLYLEKEYDYSNSNCIFNIDKDANLLVMVAKCFTVDTYIEVEIWDDEKKRKIRIRKKAKDVTYDDDLVVWDFDKGEFTTAKPLWIAKTKVASEYNLLKFSDGSELKTVFQHRIFNKEAGKFTYPMTDETPIGTTTYTADGKEVQLVSKEKVNAEVEYINIITKYHMNLFAGNVLTSCGLNNIYPIEDMKFVKDNRDIIAKSEFDVPEEYYEGLRLGEHRTEDVEKVVNDMKEHVQNLIASAKEK